MSTESRLAAIREAGVSSDPAARSGTNALAILVELLEGCCQHTVNTQIPHAAMMVQWAPRTTTGCAVQLLPELRFLLVVVRAPARIGGTEKRNARYTKRGCQMAGPAVGCDDTIAPSDTGFTQPDAQGAIMDSDDTSMRRPVDQVGYGPAFVRATDHQHYDIAVLDELQGQFTK